MRKLRALAVLVIALAGCSSVCDRERFPFAGDASTPEHACALVQYACKNECWSVLYDLTSRKTRETYSYVKFRIAFPSLKAPGREEKIHELVARTSDVSVIHFSAWGDEWRRAMLTLREGDKARDLNVILVQEKGEDGKLEWHVALAEQVEKKVAFED